MANALTQGVAVATGLQDSFDWGGVALAAVSGPLAKYAGDKVGGYLAAHDVSGTAATLIQSTAQGLTSAAVQAAVRGRVDTAQVLADVFMNFIGNDLIDKISPPEPLEPPVPRDSLEAQAQRITDQLGRDVEQSLTNNPIDISNIEIAQVNFAPDSVTVQRGDSLFAIAARQLGDANLWPAIATLNDIKNPGLIQVGADLKLPDVASLDIAKTHDQATKFYQAAADLACSIPPGVQDQWALQDEIESKKRLDDWIRSQEVAFDRTHGPQKLAEMKLWNPAIDQARSDNLGRLFSGNVFSAAAYGAGVAYGGEDTGLAWSQRAGAAGDLLMSAGMMIAGGLSARSEVGSLTSAGVREPLTYDIAKWGEYGLPSDAYFVRSLTRLEYVAMKNGEYVEFGGQPIGPYVPLDANLRSLGYVDPGYPNGMGFMGSAEQLRGITTREAYMEATQLEYAPRYLVEFQLRDPTGLSNALHAPYAKFEKGGFTRGTSFSEFNYSNLSSGQAINPIYRELK